MEVDSALYFLSYPYCCNNIAIAMPPYVIAMTLSTMPADAPLSHHTRVSLNKAVPRYVI